MEEPILLPTCEESLSFPPPSYTTAGWLPNPSQGLLTLVVGLQTRRSDSANAKVQSDYVHFITVLRSANLPTMLEVASLNFDDV